MLFEQEEVLAGGTMNVMTHVRTVRIVTTEDERAFDQAFSTHYADVYRLACSVTGSPQDAEDAVQEAFLRLHHRGVATLPVDALRPWLCRVALNQVYNGLRAHARRIGRETAAAHAPTSLALDPDAAAERTEERARVRRALAALTERQQRLLLLRHAGLSYREVASALGLAPTSVGTLLARAECAFEAAYSDLPERTMEGAGHV